MKKFIVGLFAAVAMSAQAVTITGAGASFPYPVYAKWAAGFQKETGITVNYQSIGSGGGIKQINGKVVDFGATDVAVDAATLKKKGQIQFPMVMGGVVTVVNIPGVKTNEINLTLTQVSDIFSGKIKNWKELGQGLPDLGVVLAVRADSSGTTGVFTQHLANHNTDFKNTVGVGKTVKWGGNAIAGKGNAGVAAMVQQVKGSIGYVEYAYAKSSGLTTTKIDGIEPSAAGFKSGKWILTAETYLIVYPDSPNIKQIAEFVAYCYSHDEMAEALDYVPLSKEKKVATIRLLGK